MAKTSHLNKYIGRLLTQEIRNETAKYYFLKSNEVEIRQLDAEDGTTKFTFNYITKDNERAEILCAMSTETNSSGFEVITGVEEYGRTFAGVKETINEPEPLENICLSINSEGETLVLMNNVDCSPYIKRAYVDMPNNTMTITVDINKLDLMILKSILKETVK